MSANKFKPHILVLPEDDADRQLANGFFLDPSFLYRGNYFRVEPVANGWLHVLECFKSVHVSEMKRYPHRIMVLLIDFDDKLEYKRAEARKYIPKHLTERVFILGVLSEPEALTKAGLGSPETIGLALAKDCREDTNTTWGHELLRHNESELARLRDSIRPILFDSI
jgi:hypothetical protein